MLSHGSLRFALMALLIACLACGIGGDQQATALALAESILRTATAAADNAFDAAANLQTAQAVATARRASAEATRAAASGLSESDRAATATALAPILAELPIYGLDPTQGRIGWTHPPQTLEVEGYQQYDYANRFMGTIARDFVVSADITWNTTGGLAGCGFVLRSDGALEALDQYLVIATRAVNGRVIFSTMVDGEVKNGIDHYAYGLDPDFDWRNDTTNRLTVVAQGSVFTLYTNGAKIGEVVAGQPPSMPLLPTAPQNPPPGAGAAALAEYQRQLDEYLKVVDQMQANFRARLAEYQKDIPLFDRGFVAMVALSESGRTVCQFDNAWLWLLED